MRALSAENGEWRMKASMLQEKNDERRMKERAVKGKNGEWRINESLVKDENGEWRMITQTHAVQWKIFYAHSNAHLSALIQSYLCSCSFPGVTQSCFLIPASQYCFTLSLCFVQAECYALHVLRHEMQLSSYRLNHIKSNIHSIALD